MSCIFCSKNNFTSQNHNKITFGNALGSLCIISIVCYVLWNKIKYKVVLNHYDQLKTKYIRENGSKGSSKLYQEAICYAADCIYKSDCYTTDQKEYINKTMLQDLNYLERKEKTTYSNVIVY